MYLFGPQEARKAQLENHEPEDEEEDMDMDKDAQDSGQLTLLFFFLDFVGNVSCFQRYILNNFAARRGRQRQGQRQRGRELRQRV